MLNFFLFHFVTFFLSHLILKINIAIFFIWYIDMYILLLTHWKCALFINYWRLFYWPSHWWCSLSWCNKWILSIRQHEVSGCILSYFQYLEQPSETRHKTSFQKIKKTMFFYKTNVVYPFVNFEKKKKLI